MKKKRRNLPPIKVYMSEINISPPISVRNEGNMVKKNSNLKLQIKPRPPKNKENKNDQEEQEDERPLTATLEKPQILDIKFINKIDMSLIRKEFLCITNLCRAPLTVIKLPNEGPLTDRPLSLPNCIVKKIVDVEPPRSKTSCEMNKKCKSHTAGPKKVQNLIVPIRNITKSPRSNGVTKKTENDASQKLMRIVRTNDYNKTMKLPQPCTTCGRPDQPERFHSHPVATSKSPPKPNENIKILTKSTVQKPVAIKYKSKQSESKVQKVEPVPRKKTGSERAKINSKPASGVKGPKTLMCYICGREFGTASLPLHEPRCLEKWQRENMTLPANQRMNLPKKPDIPMNSEQWNQRAWESCQASLVPCDSCGRTFLPDRLTVHQRSCNNSKTATSSTQCDNCGKTFSWNRHRMHQRACKKYNIGVNETLQDLSRFPSAPPSSVACSICGKLFGRTSIKIHEPQCLQKLQTQNELLAPEERKQLPTLLADDVKKYKRPTSTKRPTTIPCYLCGKMFSMASISIHEPQCLKKWKMENEKLPSHKRQSEPIKPDLKLGGNGQIDFEQMNDLYWKMHLDQLVPCKVCGRKFNPSRVEIHERSCKGKVQQST